jgi:hypothetical protein
MANLYEALARQLQSIDFQISGGQPSADNVRSMFRVTAAARHRAPQSLLPRLCEEHLASALTASRQAIQERQLFFTAGEKFALLALSLAADESSVDILTDEANAMSLRKNAVDAAKAGESATQQAVVEQVNRFEQFARHVDPKGEWAPRDAQRHAWMAYIPRGFTHNAEKMSDDLWGPSCLRDDPPALPGEPPLTMDSRTMSVVTLESDLAMRATIASFRVAHQRALADVATAVTGRVASEARVNTLAAAVQFEEAAAALALKRSDVAASLLARKTEMGSDVSLLGFQQQMSLHRRRANDLYAEALERAKAAVEGLRDVYGFEIADVPDEPLETGEELLFWCREVARQVVGHEPGLARQRVTMSVRGEAGESWRRAMSTGVRIDASWLAGLGNVVRIRDVALRYTGSHRLSFPVEIAAPHGLNAQPLRDRNVYGAERLIEQTPPSIRILAVPADHHDPAARGTTARALHNVCPSGTWQLRSDRVPPQVDDLLLDVDVSYFAVQVTS